MPALVVYDSQFGNTEKIATAIGEGLGVGSVVRRVETVRPEEVAAHDLLVVGSPTQGGRPTAATMKFLGAIPDDALFGKSVAAFDTRFARQSQAFFLRQLMSLIGYAAPKIASALRKRGGRQVAQPEGFVVTGREGPLLAGELGRATAWARSLRTTSSS